MNDLDSERPTRPIPPPTVVGFKAVGGRRARPPIDLHLDGREPRAAARDILDASSEAEAGAALSSRLEVEQAIAERLGSQADCVFACAGVDDAIERACRSRLGPGREIVIPEPSVERFRRVARLTGARVRVVPWMEGAYPSEAVLAGVSDETAVIAVVSPNDPTGSVVSRADLLRLSAQAPKALLVVVLRGTEFADDDLSATAFRLPNAVAICTFPSVLGPTAERVAYAVGPARVLDRMREIGFPEPLSAASVASAARYAQHEDSAAARLFVEQVRSEPQRVSELVQRLGAYALPSQADYVLCRFADARWTRDALEGLGIAVASFEDSAELSKHLRVRCPGNAASARRLEKALTTVLNPGLFFFALDEVLADVTDGASQLLREATASWGVAPLAGELRQLRRLAGGSDPVEVMRRLLERRGKTVSAEDIGARLAEIGTREVIASVQCSVSLRAVGADCLPRLAARAPLGVVSRRPADEIESILRELDIWGRFDVVVSTAGAGSKDEDQSPRALLEQAMATRGASSAWFVGGVADDLELARDARLLPIGFLPPAADAAEQNRDARGEAEACLTAAGACRVIGDLSDLEGWLQ